MNSKNELGLYRINPKYIDVLSDEKQDGDKRVQQVRENGKFQRPFIGIVVMCNNQQYCIPLTKTEGKAKLDGKNGAKKGSIDYSPIYIDGKLKAGGIYGFSAERAAKTAFYCVQNSDLHRPCRRSFTVCTDSVWK